MNFMAVRWMLNIFAVRGHFNYAKSGRLHIQWMVKFLEKVFDCINISKNICFILRDAVTVTVPTCHLTLLLSK